MPPTQFVNHWGHSVGPPPIEYAPPKDVGPTVVAMRIWAVVLLGTTVWAVALALQSEPALGALSAVVLLQFAVVIFTSSWVAGPVVFDKLAVERLTPILLNVCGRAACIAPRVVLRDSPTRPAAVMRRRRSNDQLLLSLPFIARLTDAQLRAIVAHEVSHLVRGDLGFIQVRALFVALGGYALGIGAWAATGFDPKDLPIFLAACLLGVWLVSFASSPLNRRREARADADAFELIGDGLALAEALGIAGEQIDGVRRRLFGRSPWRWLLFPLSCRMPTHPPRAQRTARLRGLDRSARPSS